jgi:UDP-N-acetyl-2-amino-2-deoxyglucuronate dehydrogenase
MSLNFAMTGVAGFVAPRHVKAIRDTGHLLVAAIDPHDAVGMLDQYSFDVHFFTEIERFDRHLEKLSRGPDAHRIHYVSICSPNHLHDAHVRLALRLGAHAICEKPLVINPWNLDGLEALEQTSGRTVNAILQMRLHPGLLALRERLVVSPPAARPDVCLTYAAPRGRWYDVSWKGSEELSGGVIANIGIHFFDLLIWLFGGVDDCEVHIRETHRAAGALELERATVRWFLSSDQADANLLACEGGPGPHRRMEIDGEAVDFSDRAADLHTRTYEAILAGRGCGIRDARPSIELVHRIRTAAVPTHRRLAPHPLLTRHAGGS